MTQDEGRRPCQALTKAGKPCQNPAQAHSDYCYVHREMAGQAPQQQAERDLEALVAELEALVAELRDTVHGKAPSPLSPGALRTFLKDNVDRLTPEVVRDIRSSLEGASAKDLADPDTWKGIGYMLRYSAQFQVEQLRERLMGRSEGDGDADIEIEVEDD